MSVKTAVSSKVRHSLERIELIDQILSSGKKIPDRESFLRLVNISLSAHGVPITLFTLDKDIKYLKELLIRYEVTLKYSQADGFHYSEPGYSYFKNSVNDNDKNLLMLANSLFNVFNGTPLKEKFSVVVNKVLAESLTGGPVIGLSEMNHLQLDSSKNNKSNQWIPTLLSSIHDQQAYEIQYKGFGKEEKKKIICPYVLKQFRNRWYVVAYDYTCERPFKTNLFALDGIQKMEISNKKYYTDPSFSPEDYFRYSLGVWHWHDHEPIVAVLEFSAQIELVLLNPLHHSQKATLSDNGKMLSVSIEVYNSPELLMIIQSYGSSVKVISPPELIDAVIGSAKKVIKLY